MHEETHAVTRIGWLRAAILGANDGIVSTASLIAGVAAAGASEASILITGSAGLVAGAMSMAAGEYVSVSSQGDAEKADVELEKRHLAADPEFELEELTQIYQERGRSMRRCRNRWARPSMPPSNNSNASRLAILSGRNVPDDTCPAFAGARVPRTARRCAVDQRRRPGTDD